MTISRENKKIEAIARMNKWGISPRNYRAVSGRKSH